MCILPLKQDLVEDEGVKKVDDKELEEAKALRKQAWKRPTAGDKDSLGKVMSKADVKAKIVSLRDERINAAYEAMPHMKKVKADEPDSINIQG